MFQIFNEIFIFCSRCSCWKSIDGGENPIRQLSTTLISPEVSWWIMSLHYNRENVHFTEGLAQDCCIGCVGQTKLSFCQLSDKMKTISCPISQFSFLNFDSQCLLTLKLQRINIHPINLKFIFMKRSIR